MNPWMLVAMLPMLAWAGLNALTAPIGLPPAPEPAPVITFEVLAHGAYSGVTLEQTQVVRDQSTWQSLWQETYRILVPIPPVPSVDFAQHMVLAAFWGEKTSGGYNMTIEKIIDEPENRRVTLIRNKPGKNCLRTMAMSQPFYWALAPASALPVTWNVEDRLLDCTE